MIKKIHLITLFIPLSITLILAQNAPNYSGQKNENPLYPDNIKTIMHRVADWQMATLDTTKWQFHPTDWTYGAMYVGLFAHSDIHHDDKKTGNWLRQIGQKVGWQTGERRFFADDYCIGQLFCHLYEQDKKGEYIEKFRRLADSIAYGNHDESLEWKNEVRLREWALFAPICTVFKNIQAEPPNKRLGMPHILRSKKG